MESVLVSGDTAWVLTSAALVLLMVPGVAFFYGGMVRSTTVLNMVMMVVTAALVVGVLWIAFGYSVAFGGGAEGSPLLGNPVEYAFLTDLLASGAGSLPTMAFVAFQAMFACVTVGLVAGSVADRMNFSAWIWFAIGWATVVYFPVAHWVWAPSGWIYRLGVVDFAGGTAVHVNAGSAGLALAVVVGRRRGWPRTPMRPGNLPLVMIGAGLLWFGWFGFNAGSALAANNTAAVVFVNTFAGACAAGLAWLAVERVRHGRPTSLGAACGIVAGLVAITPSCSAVGPFGALLIGAVAGATCAVAVGLKDRLRLDDSLDVVGVHLVGGVVGTLMIGLVATADAPAGVAGLLYGGGLNLLATQAVGVTAVMGYSLVVTVLIALALKATVGLRVTARQERIGVDAALHGEVAYEITDAWSGRFAPADRRCDDRAVGRRRPWKVR